MTTNIRVLGSISNIEEYNESDDWVVYEEMLDQYFVANRIEDVRRVPVLSVIGTESYKIMKDLSDLTLPKNRPYAEICDLLKENFTQTISVF